MRQGRGALFIAAIALLAAGAWLARPGERRAEGGPSLPALRAILVDASASSVGGSAGANVGWRRWATRALFSEAREAAEAGEDIAVVVYADEVRRSFGPERARALLDRITGAGGKGLTLESEGSALHSDLAGAMRVARELLGEEGRSPGRLVLLGDGSYTGADPRPELARIAACAHELRRVPSPARSQGDLCVVAARAPRRAPRGADLAVELDLRWWPGVDGVDPGPLHVVVDGTGRSGRPWRTTFGSATARWWPEPGSGLAPEAPRLRGSLRVVLEGLEPGDYALRATVRPEGGRDPLPHNDSGGFVVRVGDPVRVVACADGPKANEALQRATRDEAFDALDVRVVPLPALASHLPSADVLWTVGQPCAYLPTGDVERFLGRGGGWLHAGGGDLLRTDGAALSALLALEVEPEDRRPRDVLMLADGSGSMKGERWRRVSDALVDLVPEVPATDRVTVRFFYGLLGEVALDASSSDPREREAQLRRVLRADPRGGRTDVVGVLLELAEELQAQDAGLEPDAERRERLLVLLTDGISDGIPALVARCRPSLEPVVDDVLFVQVGDDRGGRRLLESLLLEGESVIRGGELEGLAAELRQKLHGAALLRGTALSPSPAAHGVARQMAEAAAGVSLPVEALVRCRLAEGAALAWSATGGEPALAVVDRGGARVATLATMPDPDWCAALHRAPGHLAATLLALAPEREAAAEEPVLRWDATQPGRVVLEAGPGGLAGWPLALEMFVLEDGALDGLGRIDPGQILARASLGPPTGGDPRVRRVGQLGGRDLERRGAGTLPFLVVDEAVGRGTPASAEALLTRLQGWRLGGRLPVPGPPEATPRERGPILLPPAALPSGARASATGPHVSAAWLLLLGALSLAAAAWPVRWSRAL